MQRRRAVVVLACAVALVAAVVALRLSQNDPVGQGDAALPTIAIAPTTVARVAEPGVVLPEPGSPPDAVGDVQAVPGDRMLRVRWAQAVSGSPPRGATGFEVHWGTAGQLSNKMLVAAPEVELRGLSNGVGYDVEVRSVDAFGRRSPPVRGSGTPTPPPPDPARSSLTGLFDDFSREPAPDPGLWAVQRIGRNCVRAGLGTGAEESRLVLDLQCGNTAAVLRARVPLRLVGGPVLGRITMTTDGPIPGGELSIALVPAPVTTLGLAAGAVPPVPPPGRAAEDPALPPGTIRAVVGAGGALITAGPGVPRTPTPAPPAESAGLVLGAPGVTARWDLQLSTDGVTLRRDGQLVASGDVVPNWSEAVALFGFAAPPGDFARLHVDDIGFTGPASEPPPVVDLAGVVGGDAVVSLTAVGPSRRRLPAMPEAQAARLQVVLGPTARCGPDDMVADFGAATAPVQAAVPGGEPPNGPYCPRVAQLPEELVARLRTGSLPGPIIRSAQRTGVVFSGNALEVTYPPGTPVQRQPATDPPGPPPTGERNRLAQLSAEIRNAAGEAVVPGDPVPHGRAVLDVRLDGVAGQRETGELAGIAGIEVRLDNQLVAGLPTVTDGPALAGSYQFGLAATRLPPGSHVIEIRVLGAQAGTRPRGLWLSFQVAQG